MMTYAREPVRMSGTLRGQGQTAACTVSATRVTLLGTRLSQDCQHAIDWVSKPLLAGDYKLALEGEGRSVDMRLSESGWHVTVLRLGQSINWEPRYGPQSHKNPEKPKQGKLQKPGSPRLMRALAMGSIVPVRFSSEDRERIEAAAKASRKTISEWIRCTLLATMGTP
jgi:hypothetical protein